MSSARCCRSKIRRAPAPSRRPAAAPATRAAMQTASEGIDAGTFLPAILLGRRSGARNVAERAAHHILDLDTGECLAFVESLCKQHRKGGFVELNLFPERLPPSHWFCCQWPSSIWVGF